MSLTLGFFGHLIKLRLYFLLNAKTFFRVDRGTALKIQTFPDLTRWISRSFDDWLLFLALFHDSLAAKCEYDKSNKVCMCCLPDCPNFNRINYIFICLYTTFEDLKNYNILEILSRIDVSKMRLLEIRINHVIWSEGSRTHRF